MTRLSDQAREALRRAVEAVDAAADTAQRDIEARRAYLREVLGSVPEWVVTGTPTEERQSPRRGLRRLLEDQIDLLLGYGPARAAAVQEAHPHLEEANRLAASPATPRLDPGGLRGHLEERVNALVQRRLGPLFDRQEQFNAEIVRTLNRWERVLIELCHHQAELRGIWPGLTQALLTLLTALDEAVVSQEVLGTDYWRLRLRLNTLFEALDFEQVALETRLRKLETAQEQVVEAVRTLQTHLDRLDDQLLLAHQAMWRGAGAAGGDRPAEARPPEREADLPAEAAPSVPRPTIETSADAAPGSGTDHREEAELDHFGLLFQNRFRGTPQQIRALQEPYLEIFDGASPVLDIGCGRGEFMELLESRGIQALGVDLNAEAVAWCRGRGLDAHQGDAIAFVEQLPPASVGGIFSSQVVEHLEPRDLHRLVRAAYRALAPGGAIVLETINPQCLYAYFNNYLKDLTHVKALHPETLKFVVEAVGFDSVRVTFCHPVSPSLRLRHYEGPLPTGQGELVVYLRGLVDQLNDIFYADQDYAVIGRKPAVGEQSEAPGPWA